jgi:hypothetical protein
MDRVQALVTIFRHDVHQFDAGVNESILAKNGVLSSNDIYNYRTQSMMDDRDLIDQMAVKDPESLKSALEELSSHQRAVVIEYYESKSIAFNKAANEPPNKEHLQNIDTDSLFYILSDHERVARIVRDPKTKPEEIDGIYDELEKRMARLSHDYIALDLRGFLTEQDLDDLAILAYAISSIKTSYAFLGYQIYDLYDGEKTAKGQTTYTLEDYTSFCAHRELISNAVEECENFSDLKKVFTPEKMKIRPELVAPLHRIFDLFQTWHDKDLKIVFPVERSNASEYVSIDLIDMHYYTKIDLERAVAQRKAQMLFPAYADQRRQLALDLA